VLARVERDRADAVPEPFTARNIAKALSDWKMWQFPFLLFCNVSMPGSAMCPLLINVEPHGVLVLVLSPDHIARFDALFSQDDVLSASSSIRSRSLCTYAWTVLEMTSLT